MIPRHARQSLHSHRATTLRLSTHSSPRSLVARSHSSASVLGQRCVAINHYRPGKGKLSDTTRGYARERNLATAVGDLKVDVFNQLSNSLPPQFSNPADSPYRTFEPNMPIIVPPPASAPSVRRANPEGVPGQAEDLFSVFDACVRVGRLERASIVLKRISTHSGISDEERIILHNQYLRAVLRDIRITHDRKQAEHLHKWYEMQIRTKYLPHTAETVACMLKASLLSERGPRLRRLVRRYMSMAPGEAGLKVLSMDEILSGQDLAVITEICPTYNYSADPEDAEGVLEAKVEESRAEPVLKDVPEIRVTPQRGEGLATLRNSLELIKDIQHVDVSSFPEADQRQIQLQIERDSISSAIARWRNDNKHLQSQGINTALSGSSLDNSTLGAHMPMWLNAMEEILKKEFKLIEESEKKESKSEIDLERCLYGPLIRQSEPVRLAAVVILTALSTTAISGADKGITASKLVMSIGKVAQEDIESQEKERNKKLRRKHNVKMANLSEKEFGYAMSMARRDEMRASDKMWAYPLPDGTATGGKGSAGKIARSREFIEDPSEVEEKIKESMDQSWSTRARITVGSVLLKLLLDVAKLRCTAVDPVTKEKVTQYQAAFAHSYQIRRGKNVGIVNMNSDLVEYMKREPTGEFLAKHLPMVVEPKPWKSPSEGGLLEGKTSVFRVAAGDVEQKLYARAAHKCGALKTVYKGLDVLGKTPWRVNRKIMDVMTDAWNSGEAITNIPPLTPEFEYPAEPDSSADAAAHAKWVHAIKAIENEKAALHSQRCFMNLQLEIARSYRNQKFYFPHNVDYRGRAYPLPTYLNHMGADHTRGLLTFADAKPLGERGLTWLKIHLANVFGVSKASFEEREAFTMENLDNIMDSVENPLGGKRWWLDADEPWQCLASCFELKAALDLPDPTQYECALPVQQDGTCNGLQHYAALGGDSWGAQQVNLEPGDRPGDVYTAVANLVEESIAKDVATGDQPYANILQGKIVRKVVKQTVMTNVYGVTYNGAKKQVCKQLDDLYPNLGKDNNTQNMLLASYVARKVFEALATMFRGAHDIQHWLGESGSRICRALTVAQIEQLASEWGSKAAEVNPDLKHGAWRAKLKNASKDKKGNRGFEELSKNFRSTVVWTTPLKMPVVQPYRKSMLKEVRTSLQTLHYPQSDQTDPVNRRKQLQGFPPNFIHSLDASHMLLAALQCYDKGLTFASVHDSFWTHAADVDIMNEVIRDAFCQIHEEDVIGRLSAEFKARHQGSLYLAHIDPDSDTAKKIKELRRTSKLTPREELLLEHKRNTLRLSGNPWDLEAAKQIVTPATVYEDMHAAENKSSWEDMNEEDPEDEASDVAADAADAEEFLGENQWDSMAQTDLVEEPEMEMAEAEEAEVSGKPASTKLTNELKRQSVKLWLPLTIPEVPEKGDFDVNRVRESKYFFS